MLRLKTHESGRGCFTSASSGSTSEQSAIKNTGRVEFREPTRQRKLISGWSFIARTPQTPELSFTVFIKTGFHFKISASESLTTKFLPHRGLGGQELRAKGKRGKTVH